MSTKKVNRQHGMKLIPSLRPKSKLRKRKNKANARKNKLKWMKEAGLSAS